MDYFHKIFVISAIFSFTRVFNFLAINLKLQAWVKIHKLRCLSLNFLLLVPKDVFTLCDENGKFMFEPEVLIFFTLMFHPSHLLITFAMA